MAPPFAIDGDLRLTIVGPPAGASPSGRTSSSRRIDPIAQRELQKLDDQLRTLRRALERLSTSSSLGTSRSARAMAGHSDAISSTSLALDPVATFTTLTSEVEVNTTPTSFSPFGPTVAGSTTSSPTLGGTYSGGQLDDVLTFTFRDNATVGTNDRLRVLIDDSAGKKVDEVNFKNQPTGTPLTLSNGLTLSLGAGGVTKNETFEVNVWESIGSAVEPSLPFDGDRNENPNFELGLGVVAGTFDVNGTTINVAADDSIDSVLARITASAAGVVASFDATTETVLLTQKTPGSAAQIVVDNDDSGFLTATKLVGAEQVTGQDGVDPVHEPISSIPALAGIQTGDLSINGVSIQVDVDADSLGDVLDRINQSSAGVVITLNPDSQRVQVTPDDPQSVLTLGDGSSGFFSGVEVNPGSYGGPETSRALVERRFRNDAALTQKLRVVRRTLNAIFSNGGRSSELGRAQDGLRETLVETYKSFFGEASSSRIRSGFGFDVLNRSKEARVDFNTGRFERALESKVESIQAFFFLDDPDESKRGLTPALISMVERLQESVEFRLGSSGSTGRRIDLRV